MDSNALEGRQLDLAAIERALRAVQRDFAKINAVLHCRRDSLDDKVIANMMAGYAYINTAIAADIDLLAPGQSKHLLELNACVLCGTDAAERAAEVRHLEATEAHFYDDRRGGVRDIVEWHQMHRGESVWRRAAGVYVRILSEPQLYIEGNHRTGALVMSYLLVREGRPPFVLTVDNAKGYFDPSTLITKTKKGSVGMMYRMPGIKKDFATFLKDQTNDDFLATRPQQIADPPVTLRA